MRKTYEYGSTGSAVLDTPEKDSARSSTSGKPRRTAPELPRQPRELADSYANDADTEAFLRASGRSRRIRRGLMPTTKNGRIAAGIGLLVALIGIGAAGLAARRYLLTSEKFTIPSSASIEIEGNTHLTRSQMLSVFGEDIARNIFKVPMHDRRAQLEVMPWVEHATVMRLLPNRIRVHITERVPVAFVRQGGVIGMVDSNGVLLDIPPDAPGNPSYSFPVVTGLRAEDPLSARAQRMKLYEAFLHDLDSDGKNTSAQLSEIDLSNPEDVKALIPDHNTDVLVHFGTEGFLSRYKKFQDHIAEWRQQYPRLSSVDMRYERQVVLQMPPRDSTVVGGAQPAPTAEASTAAEKPTAESKAKPALEAKAKPAAEARPRPTDATPKPTLATTSKPTPPAPRPLATTASRPATPPAPKPTAPKLVTATAKPVGKPVTKDAATQKKVDAIKAWMAKRQQARDAAAAKAAN
jgi:cell division protein FtsQ